MNSSFPTENNKTSFQTGETWSNYQILISIFLGILTILTISGNSLVLYIFWRSKNTLRSPVHYLLANLAVADLLVGAGVMPVLASVTVYDWKWFWGHNFCTFSEYTHFTLCAASMLSMISICVDRYVGVKFPFRHRRIMSKQRVLKIIVCIWILAVLITASPLTIWPVNEPLRDFVCPINLRTDFMFFISVGVYWIPVSTTALLYYLVYKNAVKPFVSNGNRSSINITRKTSTVSTDSKSTSTPCSSKAGANEEQKYIARKKRQTELAKRIAIVVFLMIAFYGPLFIVFLMKAVDSQWFTLNLLLATAWIRYSSSCVNVFLYAFTIPAYKQAFIKILWNEKSNGSIDDTSSFNNSCENVRKTGRLTNTKTPVQEDTSNIVKIKKCSYCTNPIAETGELSDSTVCAECNRKFPKVYDTTNKLVFNTEVVPKLLVNKVDIAENKENSSTFERNPQPLENPVARSQNSRKMSLQPEYPNEFVSEIQKVLKAMNEKSNNRESSTEPSSNKKRATKLLNLATTVTSSPVALRRQKGLSVTDQIQEFRKSVMMPIVERRSKMLTNAVEIDWESIKELDDIIAQLEINIIQPLSNIEIET